MKPQEGTKRNLERVARESILDCFENSAYVMRQTVF